jgi:hypothetical protein
MKDKEELKTLKDIKELKGGKIISRAEAIKWFEKELEREFGDRYEMKTGAFWAFISFLNLIEEDLK